MFSRLFASSAGLLALALLAPAPAFSNAATGPSADALTAPKLPSGTFAHWHAGRTLGRGAALAVSDNFGDNHLPAGAVFTITPQGLLFSGNQTTSARAPQRSPVFERFILGVDVRPSAEGPEHQTLVYLFGYCELRYRQSRGEITFNVWQADSSEPGRQLVTSLTAPLPAERWSRIQASIDGAVIRLTVNGRTTERPLLGNWQLLPINAPVLLGYGNNDRAFSGLLNHLYFAEPR